MKQTFTAESYNSYRQQQVQRDGNHGDGHPWPWESDPCRLWFVCWCSKGWEFPLYRFIQTDISKCAGRINKHVCDVSSEINFKKLYQVQDCLEWDLYAWDHLTSLFLFSYVIFQSLWILDNTYILNYSLYSFTLLNVGPCSLVLTDSWQIIFMMPVNYIIYFPLIFYLKLHKASFISKLQFCFSCANPIWHFSNTIQFVNIKDVFFSC